MSNDKWQFNKISYLSSRYGAQDLISDKQTNRINPNDKLCVFDQKEKQRRDYNNSHYYATHSHELIFLVYEIDFYSDFILNSMGVLLNERRIIHFDQ